MTLGKEFVSVTDDLFLQSLGQQVARWRDGQVLGYNLFSSDSSSRVALTHAAMTVQPHAVEHLSPQNAVQDIWLSAMTMDAWSIGTAHANIMQHSRLLNKLDIDRHMVVNEPLGDNDSEVSYLTAMKNQHPVIIITGCIVSLND